MKVDLQSYPRSVSIDGTELPLTRETRWTRFFFDPASRLMFRQSRLEDGSSTVTLSEVKKLWSSWTRKERLDFAESLAPSSVDEIVLILEFVANTGEHELCSSVAMPIAQRLDSAKALRFLTRACEVAPAGRRSNFFQALACLGTKEALAFLESQHEVLWGQSTPAEASESFNWLAFDCVNSLKYLIAMGVGREELAAKTDFFLYHPDARVRKHAEDAFGLHREQE